jgi:hypothetical protein
VTQQSGFNPLLSRWQIGEHLAQLCWNAWAGNPWARPIPRRGNYVQIYLFDDCWASAQPDLANGLLRYAQRWDVLSPS